MHVRLNLFQIHKDERHKAVEAGGKGSDYFYSAREGERERERLKSLLTINR
jgi:hypothetical protein